MFFVKSEFWEPFTAQSQDNIVTFVIGQRLFLYMWRLV